MAECSTIKVVAVFPPPTTGMTHVTQQISERLGETMNVQRFPVSRGERDGRLWSVRKHSRLIIQLFRALRAYPKTAPIYMVLDAGHGAWGSLILVLMVRFCRVPLIIHHHVFSYANEPTLASRAVFYAAGNALHITLCRRMSEKFKAHYGKHINTQELSNAGLVNLPACAPGKSHSLNTIGFISNITPEKGIFQFMEVSRNIKNRGLDANVIIAGPISNDEIKHDIEKFIAEDAIRRQYVGPVYGKQKQEFFQKIDVLLFPSQYKNEALPVTIFEALSYGVPTIATNRGCIASQLPAYCVIDDNKFIEDAVNILETWIQNADQYNESKLDTETHWLRQQLEFASNIESINRLFELGEFGKD